MATSSHARTREPAYLLHSTPYRETSLVVDLFTREHGQVAAMAKGAKRAHSALRPVLMQFQPLVVAYTGRNELRTLTSAEWAGGSIPPRGDALLCAVYLNELLVRLLAREDPHPGLYDGYAQTLSLLAQGAAVAETLRRFEWLLLRETGVAPDLGQDTANTPIDEALHYRWQPGAGFVASEPGQRDDAARAIVSGATLRDLACGRFETPVSRSEAKYLTRAILAHHLDGVVLNTRQILIDLQKL